MVKQLTTEEVLALPAAVDVVTAGAAFGIGREKSYQAAANGEFPCRTIRIGRRISVPRAEILRALGLDGVIAQSA